ncbi:Uncharacterised protein [Klebsiella pneumoniae]|nr:Uncharacterised protein [Klebsiella pneumoniae]
MVLIRNRIQQCADARCIVIQPEVGGGEHRHGFATALVKISQDANHVARFLRVSGDQHLFLKQT